MKVNLFLSSINEAPSHGDSCGSEFTDLFLYQMEVDRLCGLVVRVLGYRSGSPGSIPGHYKKSSGSDAGFTQPREYN
jgi:hypothetical protein